MSNVVNFSNRPPRRPVADGTQPPHDGGMEARVAKLESDVSYIQRDVAEARAALDAIKTSTAAIQTDVATIKERLSHTPTKLQMWTAVAAVVLTIGGGLWWVVQQYLGPILAKAAGG